MILTESGDDFLNQLAMNVGQPVIAAAVTIRQPLVVEPHLVQNGRVKIVDVDRLLDRFEAEIVGRAVDMPALNPPPATR